jgi:hypothetical protein
VKRVIIESPFADPEGQAGYIKEWTKRLVRAIHCLDLDIDFIHDDEEELLRVVEEDEDRLLRALDVIRPLASYSRFATYARLCLLDSLKRGEAPLASHLLYPQVLNDNSPEDRRLGIEAGLAWGPVADLTAVYTDHGISSGMREGIERAEREGRPVEYRQLKGH